MFKEVMMLGGGKQIKSVLRGESRINSLSVMVMLVVFFILRALVVQWSYNKVAPTLIGNWSSVSDNDRQFKPLTFEEALLFTLLISFLFI